MHDVDVVALAALDWEARAILDGLAGVRAVDGPRTWHGYLGDGSSCWVGQTGVGPERAAAVAACAPHGRLVLSAGCAGGLVPELVTGDLVLVREVIRLDDGGHAREVLPAAADAVAAWAAHRGLVLREAPLATSPSVLVAPSAKARLAATGAAIVDMESAAVAGVARRRGVPFVGLRVVLDEVGDVLPVALAGGSIDQVTGELRPVRAAMAVLGRPLALPAVVRLARQRYAAARALTTALGWLLGGGGVEALGIGPTPGSVGAATLETAPGAEAPGAALRG
jgi:adenosylhomocysteine nucleosidase